MSVIIVNDEHTKPIDEIRNEHIGEKVLVLLESTEDLSSLKGCVYAISKDISSYKEICELSKQRHYGGQQNIVIGDYNTRGVVSVQCEVK